MGQKVSIIIPCYNGMKYLTACLESILNQTYDDIELVFINDGSTEPIREMVSSYRDRFDQRGYEILYLEQENAGQSAAINYGLKNYTGSYMMWMDADDIMLPDNVSKKVQFLEENPDCGFVLCELLIVPAEDTDYILRRFRRNPPKGKDTLFQDLIFETNVVYGCGVCMVRRDAFETAFPTGRIIENQVGQNLQLLIPLAYHNKCGYIPEALYKYVRHSDSHFSRVRGNGQWIDRHEAFKKLLIGIVESLNQDGLPEYKNLNKERLIREIKRHRTDQQMKIALKSKDIGLIWKVWRRYEGLDKGKWPVRFWFHRVRKLLPV